MAWARSLPDRLLTLGAVLGGALLLAVSLGAVLDVRPVFLRSGSMAPDMPTGTLSLTRQVPATSLAVGDVVCVEAASGTRVTHRIVSVKLVDDVALLTLRGDANSAADAQTYAVHHAARVIAHVPAVGYLLGWLSTPGGLVLSGAIAGGLLILAARGGRRASIRRGGTRRARRPLVLGSAVVLLVLGPGNVSPVSAVAWTDAVPITGAALSAATIPAPSTFACGALGILSVQFNWAAVSGATNYTLHYGSGGASTATITGTSATLTSAISGGTAWVVANRNFGSATWSSLASVARPYTVAVVSLCG